MPRKVTKKKTTSKKKSAAAKRTIKKKTPTKKAPTKKTKKATAKKTTLNKVTTKPVAKRKRKKKQDLEYIRLKANAPQAKFVAMGERVKLREVEWAYYAMDGNIGYHHYLVLKK